MQQTERPSSARTAAELEARYRFLGYQPGRPVTYAPMAAAVDRSTARKMRCPACNRRGMGAKHFHRDGSVRCIAVCPSCRAGTEV